MSGADAGSAYDEMPKGGSAWRPTDHIHGYRMIRPLYRGGQGVVYLAEQLSTKREVALKVLYDGALAGEVRKRRFEREIELVAALKHRHIVPVFDSGINEGRFFYSMEYVEGQRLSDYVKSPQMSVN